MTTTFLDPSAADAFDPRDITSVESPQGWLTDAALRQILSAHGNFTPTSSINLVDPSFLSAWIHDLKAHHHVHPTSPPPFLTRTASSATTRPTGLAIPFHENNDHWTVFYVNLEARGTVWFNSMPSWGARSAERVMERFFRVFEMYFREGVRGGAFRFEVDERCARQRDGSSSGIYAVRNLLDLLDHRRPEGQELSVVQIRNFRVNAGRLLRTKYAQCLPSPPLKNKKQVHFK